MIPDEKDFEFLVVKRKDWNDLVEVSVNLAQQVEDLQTDAARYRWLIKQNLGVFMQVGGKIEGGQPKEKIDSSIDEAMK